MAAYDTGAQGAVDAYASTVQKQKEYAAQFEQNVREVLVPKDEEAEKTVENSYRDLKYATGVFDAASSDKLTLQQQKDALIAERDRRIAAIEAQIESLERQSDGNNQNQILLLKSKIPVIKSEYMGRLAQLDFSLGIAGRTALIKQATLAEAKSIYQNDRFNNIATSSDVISGFLQSAQNWHEVGKMMQHQGFLQAQADAGQRRLDLNG